MMDETISRRLAATDNRCASDLVVDILTEGARPRTAGTSFAPAAPAP
jgi:hypothetical protein